MGKYYLGLDGGSTYLKAALMKDKKVIGTMVYPTGIDNNGVAKKIVAALCKKYGIRRTDIGYIMATGYNRCFRWTWVRNLLQPDYQYVSFYLCGIPFRRCEKRGFVIRKFLFR